MRTTAIESIREMLRATKGRFFHVQFIKADGTLRDMSCRIGVTKYLKGGEKTFSDLEKGILTVFDIKAGLYKSFRIERLLTFTFGGVTMRFDQKGR